jgi:hypothetical protein
MTGVDGACGAGKAEILAPHFIQNTASSGSCAPHLGQYKVTTPLLQYNRPTAYIKKLLRLNVMEAFSLFFSFVEAC